MPKAMLIFEDDGENVDIWTENAVCNNPTCAQSAVLELFKRIWDATITFERQENYHCVNVYEDR